MNAAYVEDLRETAVKMERLLQSSPDGFCHLKEVIYGMLEQEQAAGQGNRLTEGTAEKEAADGQGRDII